MKFIVVLTRYLHDSETAEAIVEAETEELAKTIALDNVDRDRLSWHKNNDFDSETEVTSVSAALPDAELSALDEPHDAAREEGCRFERLFDGNDLGG